MYFYRAATACLREGAQAVYHRRAKMQRNLHGAVNGSRTAAILPVPYNWYLSVFPSPANRRRDIASLRLFAGLRDAGAALFIRRALLETVLFFYSLLISITWIWLTLMPVSVVMVSEMRATAASLRPSVGAGTATVTPSPVM